MIRIGIYRQAAKRNAERINTACDHDVWIRMTVVKLENRCARERTEGSNPSLSAN
jgi:hypothetical protein